MQSLNMNQITYGFGLSNILGGGRGVRNREMAQAVLRLNRMGVAVTTRLERVGR